MTSELAALQGYIKQLEAESLEIGAYKQAFQNHFSKINQSPLAIPAAATNSVPDNSRSLSFYIENNNLNNSHITTSSNNNTYCHHTNNNNNNNNNIYNNKMYNNIQSNIYHNDCIYYHHPENNVGQCTAVYSNICNSNTQNSNFNNIPSNLYNYTSNNISNLNNSHRNCNSSNNSNNNISNVKNNNNNNRLYNCFCCKNNNNNNNNMYENEFFEMPPRSNHNPRYESKEGISYDPRKQTVPNPSAYPSLELNYRHCYPTSSLQPPPLPSFSFPSSVPSSSSFSPSSLPLASTAITQHQHQRPILLPVYEITITQHHQQHHQHYQGTMTLPYHPILRSSRY
jgi:hypothetical protein